MALPLTDEWAQSDTYGFQLTFAGQEIMDFIGEILVKPDSSGFTRQQWIDLIREHPNLVNPRPREGINPFTKELIIFPLRLDIARVVVDGKTVGSMS
jgi:hypothetical protein